MMTYSVVLLHDNARLHTDARIRALLDHFNWELFDHPPYSPDLAPTDYHLFTCLKNWLRSQCFNNNELMEGVKTWLSLQVAFLCQDIQKPVPHKTSASIMTVPIPTPTYVRIFVHNKFFSLLLLAAHRRSLSE
jgi:hypothetical protein